MVRLNGRRARTIGPIEDYYTDVELARAATFDAVAEPAPDGVTDVVADEALDNLPIAMAPAPSTVPMAQLDGPDRPPSRAATWTVAAALCVGLVCGFGGGYLARGREARADRARSTAAPTMTRAATACRAGAARG